MNISERIKSVAPSGTLAMSRRAGEMKKEGIDVVSFGAGEPDFDTPQPIIDAAREALDAGYTRYGPTAGLPELREAICKHIGKRVGVEYSPDQIIVTCGAKAAIFMALQVLLDPGDEVIIPAPYWVSYPDQVKLAGGVPKILDTKEENGFHVTAAELEGAINKRTKVLIINSPSNPTGAVYTKGRLKEIVEVCFKNGVLMIADEIYDQLTYDHEFTSVISSDPEAPNNVIYVNGVSKSYAMTGWRMGYAAGPKDAIAAMVKYQEQLLTCIPPFVQKAVIAAINAPPSMTHDMFVKFKERRDMMMSLLGGIPAFRPIRPEGAFYVFVNIGQMLRLRHNGVAIGNSGNFADFLLNEAHVAVVPGSAFGAEGYIRLSFATSADDIKKGVSRIKEALSRLS